MKKTVLLLTVFLLSALIARAVQAPKTPYPYTQPDGTVIMLVNHGDEFYSWITCDDQIVEKDAQGYYRPVSSMGPHRRRAAAAESRRRQANEMYLEAAKRKLGMGEKHFLVILIEFDDLEFTVPYTRDAFDRMLNQPGYSENEGTGSARDFYIDNSSGAFQPVFDVYGPVKVPKSYSYYGQKEGDTNDLHADEALFDACVILDDALDFSQYDLDGDGYVDNVFFFFAGYNQAEGAPDDTIWPHKWALFRHQGYFDGVRVYNYACSSEYRGTEGENMAGIGTFVHEFGHVIGLPDFYDTNYEKDGMALDPGRFSTMANGNYLNEGRTPPCFTSVERQMLGWMGEFPFITASGEYSLDALAANALPLVSPSDVEGEVFIYEYRNGKGWDSFLPNGMVIYHLDQSDNICHDDVTARQMWEKRTINTYGIHPCFYIVSPIQGGENNPSLMVFPGERNISHFTPVAWSGNETDAELNRIRIEGGQVKMDVIISQQRRISGYIQDQTGRPIEGAELILSVDTPPAAGAALQIRSIHPSSQEIRYSTTSGADGSYEFLLDENDQTESFRLCASMDGYIEQSQDISVNRKLRCDFTLRSLGSPAHSHLQKYDLFAKGKFSRLGYGVELSSIMGASYFSADDLRPYSGMQIQSVSFVMAGEAKSVKLVIDTDSKRLLVRDVPEVADNKFTEVDVSDLNLTISAGLGMYFGYAVEEPAEKYSLVFQKLEGGNGMCYASYDLEKIAWIEYTPNMAMLISVTLLDETASQYITLGTLDVNSIHNPKQADGYVSGDIFTFQLVEALYDKPSKVAWFYDNVEQSAGEVVLSSGTHVVKAHLTFPDGGEEDVFLELNVQ